METVNWKVDGMDCSNCVLTIRQFLEKKGLGDVKVNLAAGDVSFTINGVNKKEDILKGIESLGYSVDAGDASIQTKKKRFLKNHKERFLFCIILKQALAMMLRERTSETDNL